MKRYLYKLSIISYLVFLIGCKNNSTNKNYSPEASTQNPTDQMPETSANDELDDYNIFDDKEFNIIKYKNLGLQEFGTNLFEKYCDSSEYFFVNCDFTRLPRIFNYGFIKFCEKINWIDCLKYKTNLLL